MAKGNIGDRIRIVAAMLGESYSNGNEGRIVGVERYGSDVVMDNCPDYDDEFTSHYIYTEEYEVIPKTEEKVSSEVIPWAVGQNVWDTVFGKGTISAVFPGQQVQVKYEDVIRWYTPLGVLQTLGAAKHRSLFFSEPKIEAELFPPKKPFTPVLKEGDKVIATKYGFDAQMLPLWIEKETEEFVQATTNMRSVSLRKSEWGFHKVGEKVKFNV